MPPDNSTIRSRLISCLSLVVLALCAGCEPPVTADSVTKRYAALLDKVASRLDQVQTSQDAEQAAADVQKLLQQSDAIAQAARKVDAKGKVSDAVQQQAKDSSARLAASVERLRNSNLMNDSLRAAVEQVGYSFEAVAKSVAVGKLPRPETPIEEGWVEVIECEDALADLLATLNGPEAAERAIEEMVKLRVRKHAAFTKIAEAGGDGPPSGIPKKYRAHYDAVQARVNQMDGAISNSLGSAETVRLHEKLQEALAAEPSLDTDPFHLPSAIRTAKTKATITLRNNPSIGGPMHQYMVNRLRQLAGATDVHPEIGSDGTYRLLVAPVADFNRLIEGIDFGTVSQRDDAAMSFTLTIDPEKIGNRNSMAANPADRGPPGPFGPGGGMAGAGGFRGPGGPRPFPGGGNSQTQLAERIKADFAARNGGLEKCVILVLDDAPEHRSPADKALGAAAKKLANANSAGRLGLPGGEQVLILAPVEDLDAFAAKIDFGTVTSKDPAKREIHVTIDASKLQP